VFTDCRRPDEQKFDANSLVQSHIHFLSLGQHAKVIAEVCTRPAPRGRKRCTDARRSPTSSASRPLALIMG